MGSRKVYFIGTILVFLSFNVLGQENIDQEHFYGRTFIKNTIETVPFAHIYNLSTRKIVIADSAGYFNIPAIIGDTLLISAIGYEYVYYPVSTESFHDFSEWIFMKKKTYEIEEAKIVYLGDYRDFKYKLLALKLPEDKIKINEQLLKSLPNNYTGEKPLPGISSPVSLFYSLFSKEGDEARRYEKALIEEKTNLTIVAKFNPKVVARITGLNGDSLYKFIEYCNFTDPYLIEVLEIDLYQAILKKLIEFQK